MVGVGPVHWDYNLEFDPWLLGARWIKNVGNPSEPQERVKSQPPNPNRQLKISGYLIGGASQSVVGDCPFRRLPSTNTPKPMWTKAGGLLGGVHSWVRVHHQIKALFV